MREEPRLLVAGLALNATTGFLPPVMRATLQAVSLLGAPVGLGMWVRHRWPDWAEARRPLLQRASVAGIAALLGR